MLFQSFFAQRNLFSFYQEGFTTNEEKPVIEKWFIAVSENNEFMKLWKDDFFFYLLHFDNYYYRYRYQFFYQISLLPIPIATLDVFLPSTDYLHCEDTSKGVDGQVSNQNNNSEALLSEPKRTVIKTAKATIDSITVEHMALDTVTCAITNTHSMPSKDLPTNNS